MKLFKNSNMINLEVKTKDFTGKPSVNYPRSSELRESDGKLL